MGEGEVEEKVEPAPLQLALLYKILKVQRETLEFLKSITAEGVDVPLPEVEVTRVEYVDFKHVPLRSVDLFNKGPDPAYYRVNDDAKEIKIENREYMTIRRPRPTIWRLTLRVDRGKRATLKLIGHY